MASSARTHRLVLPFIAAGLALTAAISRASAQAPAVRAGSSTGTAVRATRPPVIDGREDDEVWRTTPAIGGFRQFDPSDDAPPTFQTEFRVAYDDHDFYVLVRAYDPHPDSIIRLLSRRDVKTSSDQIRIVIDGFFDRRNAIGLAVNPAGVKRDGVIHSDNIEDSSWDGVWDVGVQVDEKGWVAEFRVPFSQLRFRGRESNTFGFGVSRDIARLAQRDAWPVYHRSTLTIVSQLGSIDGIRDVPGARRIELLPYVVTKSVPDVSGPGRANTTQFAAGLDAKAGLGSSLTLDATVNPDFGQVESDPSILNLTAFETRFDERRLFFQEGIGLFRCGAPCDGPFYTRRIGRTPQLRTSASDPAFTTILGAAKVTGRFGNGYTIAVLDALTNEMHGSSGAVIEPRTNYFVMRTAREARDGSRSAGLFLTDVRRDLDPATAPFLKSGATSGILQGMTRFARNRYEAMGYWGRSFVTGSAAAIAATQRSSVHYFQRPDHEKRYDPTLTALSGGAIGGSVRKIRGTVKFETFLRHSTPEHEVNDIGLVPLVNDMSIRQSVDYQQGSPSKWFRSSFSQLSGESHWTTGGLPAARSIQLHTSASLHNSWGGAFTVAMSDLGGVNCVSCARGGPSLRQSPKQTVRFDVVGDPRPAVVPSATVIVGRSDEGQSSFTELNAGVSVRVASRFSASLAGAYNHGVNDQQWVGNFGAFLSDTTHYTFARLHQSVIAIVARANWTATPTLSLQLYAQPFITAGSYSSWRELGAPRAEPYASRFRAYGNGAVPAGFNVKQFNSNAVMRWEFRPASVLFLVWQQGRNQNDLNLGSFDGSRDVRDLFSAPPQNTLLMKFSYWFNP